MTTPPPILLTSKALAKFDFGDMQLDIQKQHERGRVQVIAIQQYAKSFAKGIYVQSCIYLRMRNEI